jgi:two-component system NtrC family sensor kinase
VACQWRIRHKLILGLGLVIGIMALLLAGTLKGLLSYSTTLKSIDSKLAELSKAEDFKTAVADLDKPPESKRTEPQDKVACLESKMAHAQKTLAAYQEQLQDTLNRRRDPKKGFQEIQLIDALREDFEKLSAAVKKVRELAGAGSVSTDIAQTEEQNILGPVIDRLRRDAAQLRDTLYDDLRERIDDGKNYYRSTMVFVITTSMLGVVLLVSLTRFIYRWVFYPVRELERGVGRVAEGDFEQRIEVHSGDEMEDLAEAFNDMTRRLREMYRDLAHQVNERSRQLVRSERLAGVGFLAAGVAHEINNPLASIAFCSEALESRLKEIADGRLPIVDWQESNVQSAIRHLQSDWEVVSKYLKMIQEEAFRCKAITQRLLEFSRGGERRREPADLAEVVQSVLDMVQHLQSCKGKRLVFEPSARLVAWVNAQEVKSVVLNLVVNALDSMDDGGTLTITLAQRDRMAEVVFADTGCGMSPDILENIFEPFFTRSRTGKGTGLGLSISHRIVSQHGGEIEATSPGSGRGSTFTVRLPLQPAEEQGSGVRSQGSGVRDQESEVGGQGAANRGRRAA